MKYLIVVDMQVDFVSGVLGTKEAQAITGRVKEKIDSFEGRVIYTRDTHEADYLSTQEGRNLPVKHCIKGTSGWQIVPELEALRTGPAIDKPAFGSMQLACLLAEEHKKEAIESITLIGLCTDICVISNALILKAQLPEVPVSVDAACCAGVTPESHKNALGAMRMCQIQIEND